MLLSIPMLLILIFRSNFRISPFFLCTTLLLLEDFFFGEERTPDSGKEIIYERPTDDKLPSITTEEVEQLQEGGYDDTSMNLEKAAPVTEVPETPSTEEPKEVQP